MVRFARVLVVFLKELTDTLRDRKSLINLLVYAVMGPLGVAATATLVIRSAESGAENVIELPVIGAESAPQLIEALCDANIKTVKGPDSPRTAVATEAADAVLVIPKTYGADLKAMRPAQVTLITDDARESAAGRVGRVRHALHAYGMTLGTERLLARGVSPVVSSPLAVIEDDVAPPEARGAMLLATIPLFLMMAFMMGGAHTAIDLMAGERERGSLEPLMSNAVTDAEIILGKGGALAVLSMGAATLVSVGSTLSVSLVPSVEQIGMRFALPLPRALQFVLWMLPLVPLTSSGLLWISARAKTVRDANTQVMLLGLVPTLAGTPLLFGSAPNWVLSIPVVGQQLLVVQALRGSPPSLLAQLGASTSALLVGIAVTLLFIAAQGRSREQKAAE